MPADPRRVKAIFGAALAVTDPAARADLLDRECQGDAGLRHRLDDLLRAHDHPASALERPLAVAPGDVRTIDHVPTAGPGTVLASRYKLLELIGEGGMGEVWVADQLEPIRRRVAVKTIKRGMDTRNVLARFEAERQALALMDHPNIAKVLDADTTADGRSFFVMELVKGTPITEFCDARKLAPRERLGLFVQVCNAIQHAHQKGLIHRDIKPSNVLVALHDEVPVPKVIDFGVAKAVGQQLTDKTVYTAFGALIGTPAYMAPEQATFNQLDVDTRADVYALGVLLYELLAGSPPFEPERLKQAALDEVLRLVREEEPPRPSHRLSTSQAKATIAATRQADPDQLARLIRGELDWIVMKSLEKDRGRRYDSPAGLAKDVERYLKDERVEACPPTLGYRMRKTVRKHKAAILTAVAFAAVLVGGAAVAAWQAVRATDAEHATAVERDRTAEQRDAADEARTEAVKQFKIAKENLDRGADTLKRMAAVQNKLRAAQYWWDMQSAPLAWEAGHIAHLRGLLDRHRTGAGDRNSIGFEWHYWDRKLNSEIRLVKLPSTPSEAPEWVFSEDATKVVSVVPAKAINIGGRPIDQFLKVWDAVTGKELMSHVLQQSAGRARLGRARFSADGSRLAVSWSADRGPTRPNPDGTLTPYRQVRVLEVPSGKTLVEYAEPSGDVDRWNLSADGRRFAVVAQRAIVAGASFPTIKMWDVGTGASLFTASGDADGDFAPAFSADGDRIACVEAIRGEAGVRMLKVLDAATGKPVNQWKISYVLPPALAFSPDGVRLAGVVKTGTPREAEVKAEVKVWDRTAGTELHTLPAPSGADTRFTPARVAFNVDGSRLIAYAAQGILRGPEVKVFDPVAGQHLFSFTTRYPHDAIVFSHDGKSLVAGDGPLVTVRDVTTGQVTQTAKGHASRVTALAVTADDAEVRAIEFDGTLKAWPVRPRPPVVFAAPPRAAVGATALAGDGRRLAMIVPGAGDDDAKPDLTVWDTATGKAVHTLPLPPTPLARANYQVAFSADGRRLAVVRWPYVAAKTSRTERAAADKAPADLTLWDARTGRQINTVTLTKLDILPRVGLGLNHDGTRAAVFCERDRTAKDLAGGYATLRVLDTATGKPVFEVPAQALGTRPVFSPDGRRLAGAVKLGITDGNPVLRQGVQLWDAETGKEQLLVVVNGVTATPAWSPDGSRLAIGLRATTGVGMLKVHDAATGKELLSAEDEAGAAGNRGVTAPTFTPDGRRIAAHLGSGTRTAGSGSEVRVWDAATGKELLVLKAGGSEASELTFSPDGYRLIQAGYDPTNFSRSAASRNITVTVWDATPRSGGARE
jgi:eukaryotic-like serine/threonine-protein kinase